MSKKLGVIGNAILKMKLRAPSGVQLTEAETGAVIDVWKEDQKTLATNSKSLESVAYDIKRTLDYKLPEALSDVTQARTEALRYFKVTKEPIKKREWARRLVIADKARKSIKGSEKRMKGMSDRIKSLVADASLEKQALDIRIAEAEMYQKMGQGLHLVGESLVEARFRAKSAKVEFTNLELGIEAIERTVKQTEDKTILAQAKAIAENL